MKRKGVSYAKYGYIFSIPFVVAFLLFQLYPIFYTLFIGFTNLKGFDTALHIHPKGLFYNFKWALTNDTFITGVKTTFLLWICNFIPQISLALILAAWFTNERMKLFGKGFFKVVFYLPNIITAASVAVLFSSLFYYPVGPVNDLLQKWGVIDAPMDFFNDKWSTRLLVIFIQFWMWYGYTMIVLISGILGISPELFEAADIDGANGLQKFLFVTIPNTKTILLYTMITSLIGGLQMFDIPYLITNGHGEPRFAIQTASVFIYNQGFTGEHNYATAAACSMIMFVIIGVLSAIVFYMMRDKDEAALHKVIKAQEKAYRQKLKEQKKGGSING